MDRAISILADEPARHDHGADDSARAGQSGLLLIAENYDAFAVRILAAREAKHSLDLMYYLWHDDLTGRLLAREVVAAADRGVKVRMLIDDINPRASDAAYLALNSHSNIELRLFNPSGYREGRLFRAFEFLARSMAMTRRMHTKAWISDGRVAIVGGRNVGDAYFGAAETNFRDLDLLLLGPAVEQTAGIFRRFWNCDAAVPIHKLNPRRKRRARRITIAIDPHAGERMLGRLGSWQSVSDFASAQNGMHWIPDVQVISDPPEKVRRRRRRNWLMKELLPLIQSAQRSLEIVSPYFIPGRKGVRVLESLITQGVDVTVLTNSLAATDVAAVHGAYRNYRARLLRAGVRLFELQPFGNQPNISVFGSKGASLHTKAFVVDGRKGFVGSFNFDPRSVSLNAEMGVVFDDEALVAELVQRFDQEKSPETSYRLSLLHGAVTWEGNVDGKLRTYRTEPEAGIRRRIVSNIVRLLPIESQL